MIWPFVILFLVQCAIAGVVIFILKKLLDRELIEAALEKLEAVPSSVDIRAVVVKSPSPLNEQAQGRVQVLCRRKFSQAQVSMEQDSGLKGGVHISVGAQVLDYSLAERLRHLWS